MSETIKIPVQAVMRRQPNGSYRATERVYAEADTDTVARWLLRAHFGLWDVQREGEFSGVC